MAAAWVTDFFKWTTLSPKNTELPVLVWVSVDGCVTTHPYYPTVEHTPEVAAWVDLNFIVLMRHWRGEIDAAEMLMALERLP